MRMILTLVASAAMLAACGGGDAALKKGREAPLVTVAAVQSARFVERIDAVGTARDIGAGTFARSAPAA